MRSPWSITRVGGGSDRGLGAERDAEPGFAEHGEIVRAVADRHRVLMAKAEAVAQLDQGRELRLAPEDRLLDAAGERLAFRRQPVRAVLVEADHLAPIGPVNSVKPPETRQV